MKKTVNLLKFVLVLSVLLTGITSHAINRYKPKIGNSILLATSPTSISGPSSICAGSSATLTAIGATLNSGEVYQWGTGTTIGSNVISGQTGVTIQVTPNVTTSYWVRVINSTTLVATAGVIKSITVNAPATPSIAPTSITGTTTICNGSSTTLTAVGATLLRGAVYQWGNSPTIGSNILAGQTGPTITVTPTGTTTFWVRVLEAAPCSTTSEGITTIITVVNPSSTPTSITGNTTVCLGSSTTLQASGGNAATGCTYQWGTGTDIGYNIISGEVSSKINVSPNSNTSYWVKRIDNSTCVSSTGGISTLVNVTVPSGDQTSYGNNSWIGYVYANHNTTSNPVVEDVFATSYRGYITQNEVFDLNFPSCVISGANVCGTYNTKYAVRFKMNKNFAPGNYNFLVGGDDGFRLSLDGGATYVINKWNAQAYTTASATIYLSGDTNLILEYFQGPLSVARVSFNYTSCVPSTAPTAITGNTTTCSGTSTTLTASGGIEVYGATYQWGTGSVVGSNIISGQTSSSITVAPTSTITYWVRRIDAAPCSLISSGITTTVTVTSKSTAPTWTSGATSICLNYGTTITANGGTAATGCTYQWGTGSVIGTNPISGQTAQSLSIVPTGTTTYWVRRLDNGVCSAYTDGVSVTVSVVTPPGDPAAFGSNQWNVYGYSTGDITLATALYAGNYSLNALNFDTQTGTNSWDLYASPSASAGWVGCSVPNDNFTFVAKRKGFPCGNYTLKMLNWDDEARLFINGTQVWLSNTWSGSASTTSGTSIGTYNLDSNSTVELRIREYGGGSNASLSFTNNNTFVPSTDPTAITGITSICNGTSTTLTATGGTISTSGSYQWGMGSTIGSNIIAGQNNASITVSPTSDTTYWVRRVDTTCNNITGGLTQTVAVISSVGGTLSANQNICAGTSASDIVLTGNVGSVQKWQKSTDASFATSTDILTTSSTLSSNTIGLLNATTYFRAVVANGSCSSAYSSVSGIIVAPASVGGTISGGTRVCSGTNTTTLTLGGKVGSIIKWQSSTSLDFSTNVTDIANTMQSLTISNLTTTTYYRAVVQNGMCTTANSSTGTITVDPITVGGIITGNKNYCAGLSNSTVLTLTGKTGNVIKWQSSITPDFSGLVTDITNNSVTLVVSNVTTTTYYRAVVQSGSCASAYSTSGIITIDAVSVGGTVSGSASVCPGSNSTTLTLNGNFGTIQWQSSTNNSTFTTISGATSSTYTANNLNTTTYYRALSSNGSCSATNSTVGTVSVDALTISGTISGNSRVCSGSNTTTMTLSGYNGNLQWQSSSDNLNFNNITGATLASYTANDLTATNYYRVVVQNGTCLPVTSGVATILVDAPSIGGTITGTTTVCTGSNATALTLSGNIGAVQWQSSTNNLDFTDIAGATSSTYTASNLTTTAYFRASVTNGRCNAAFSSVGTITVVAPPTAGTISGATTVCSGVNSTALYLSGNSGNAIQWQYSTNNSNFISLSGAIASNYTASNLNASRYYRVVVSNGICPTVSSDAVIINVDIPSVGGTVTGSARYCVSDNATTTLTLSNNVGNVIKWQSSTVSNFSTNVQDIANTTTNLAVSNLTTTTYFRAVVQNGTCNPTNSSIATITVDALSVGGSITGSTSVCPNVNVTSLTLNGQVGNVMKWQSSLTSDFSGSIIDIANSTSTLVVTNLSAKTYYRAIVANGTCSSAMSSTAIIDIKPLLGSIGEITGTTSVCGLSSATYSIAPVANATDYIWTFPSGLSVYSSAGNSVVVNIDELFRDGVITVKATNGCQVSLVKTIAITKKPKLSTINGPIATCGITTGTYIANTLTGATYDWNVPAGITITSGQGTPTIQVSYDPNYVTGTIGVTASNSCGVSDVLEYRVNSMKMPTIINGLAQIGAATSGTYTTPAISGMGYLWNVPTGVTIASGQNTNAVVLNFDPSFTMGTITVSMISSCGTSIPRTFDINRSQPIRVIYGPESLCGIAQITYDTIGTLLDYTTLYATYTVPPVSDALQYVWTVPQGATIVSGQGTNSIVMGFDIASFVNGNVTVSTITAFGTGASKSLTVKRVGGKITGIANVCDLTTATYSIPNTIGINFTWSVPSWMTITSGQGTNSIIVSVATPFANDNVKVNFLSNCNSSENFILNVGCNKSSNVRDSQCGTTLANLDSSVYPNPVSGAQAYRYQVTNGSNVRVYEPTTPLFNLTQLPGGVTYNTTYSIQVAVKINGVWGGFGSPCDITTPAPSTKVKTANCGTTLATISTSIYADALIGVQGYRFEVTDGTNVRTFDATTNLFNLTQLTGGVAYNTTYSIKVAANANGVWGAYGTSCTVTTSGVALTKVTDAQCGTTLTALNSSIYYGVIYGAQAYRFEVTNGASVVTYDLTNTASLFNLTQLVGGANYATTYSIRVASNVNGTWSNYGAACTITTPAAITKVKAQFCGTTLTTLATSIYADALIGVQGYRFEVTDGTNVRTYDATSNLFNLTQLTGGTAYNTNYSIRVAVNVNGTWGAYGASCVVTTPLQQTAKQVSSEVATSNETVFTVKGYPNPFNSNFNLELNSSSNDPIEISIYDIVGKLLTKDTIARDAINTASFGDNLPSGVYNVVVNQGTELVTLKMIRR